MGKRHLWKGQIFPIISDTYLQITPHRTRGIYRTCECHIPGLKQDERYSQWDLWNQARNSQKDLCRPCKPKARNDRVIKRNMRNNWHKESRKVLLGKNNTAPFWTMIKIKGEFLHRSYIIKDCNIQMTGIKRATFLGICFQFSVIYRYMGHKFKKSRTIFWIIVTN